jgi:hypothetical protein
MVTDDTAADAGQMGVKLESELLSRNVAQLPLFGTVSQKNVVACASAHVADAQYAAWA